METEPPVFQLSSTSSDIREGGLPMKRDLEALLRRRRTIKHTIRVLCSTVQSIIDNDDRIKELERQLTELETQIREERGKQ